MGLGFGADVDDHPSDHEPYAETAKCSAARAYPVGLRTALHKWEHIENTQELDLLGREAGR